MIPVLFPVRWTSWAVYGSRAWKSSESRGQKAAGEQREAAHHVQGVDPVQVSQGSSSTSRARGDLSGMTFSLG